MLSTGSLIKQTAALSLTNSFSPSSLHFVIDAGVRFDRSLSVQFCDDADAVGAAVEVAAVDPKLVLGVGNRPIESHFDIVEDG